MQTHSASITSFYPLKIFQIYKETRCTYDMFYDQLNRLSGCQYVYFAANLQKIGEIEAFF